MEKNFPKQSTSAGASPSKIKNPEMSRIWWLGTFSGIISALTTWNIYKQYSVYLDDMPTLLALFILTGIFCMMTFVLRNVALYSYDTIKQLLKKLMGIILPGSGLEISFVNDRLYEIDLKIDLLRIGFIVLILTTCKHYRIFEAYEAFLRRLPTWSITVIDLVGALWLFWAYLLWRKKKHLPRSSLNKQNQNDTPSTDKLPLAP